MSATWPAGLEVTQDLRERLPGLRELAVDLASGAGELAVRGRSAALADGGGVGVKSTRTDVVTAMDRAAEDYLRERLARERPGDAVLGEEAGAHGSPSEVTWVLDPIDGTVNYLYGREEYAVSVAAVFGDPSRPGAWRRVAGGVARPASGGVYHAHDGGGAGRSVAGAEVALRVGDCSDLGLALLATGFAYDAAMRREQARALVRILPAVRDIRRGGSAALDLCAVAEGTADAYVERGVHAWDVAAGWVIALEAGAAVSWWDSGPQRPLGIAAASPTLAPALAALIAAAYEGG